MALPSPAKFKLDSKYKGLEDNIWLELGQLYQEEGGVNLGQGFPDFNPSMDIVKELEKVCAQDCDHSFHQYARAFGHGRLAQALAGLYGHLIQREIDPWKEVLVTGGAYGALFYSIMSNVGPGDQVIIIEPFFDCYEPFVLLAGGTPVYIQLRPGVDSTSSASLKLDSEQLKAAFNAKTKAIIINTPNNPSGKVFSREELLEIARLCQEHDVMVISDEVYEWMIYQGQEHIRMCSLPGMWDRTITIGSAGKTFSLTGWKLGWAYGPALLIANLNVAHQNCTYMCQTPEQEAVGVALERQLELIKQGRFQETFFHRLVTDLTRQRAFWLKAVQDAGFQALLPQGGYFMLVDWTPLGPIAKLDDDNTGKIPLDQQAVRWLAKSWKLHTVPPSAFCSSGSKALLDKYLRFNFYKKQETLDAGRAKLMELGALLLVSPSNDTSH